LTCYHNLDDILDENDSVKISRHDGSKLRAVLKKEISSIELDIAVLKVDLQNENLQDVPHLRLGSGVEPDEIWLTLGYYFPNQMQDIKNSGSIHSTVRRADNKGDQIKLSPKHKIRGGVSGSPVFHHNSNTVVGIIKSEAGDREAFAVPIADVLKIWPALSDMNSSPSQIDDDIVPEDLRFMLKESYYSAVYPQLSRIDQCYITNKDYLLASKSILFILKNLNYFLKAGHPAKFHEYHEKVSLGLIPYQWMQGVVKDKNYNYIKKTIVHFFNYNRIKIDGIGGQGEIMPLPVVLVIMSRAQAEELTSGNAFIGCPPKLLNDFLRLKSECLDGGLPNWQSAYTNSTTSWSPFFGHNVTIENAIKEIVDKISIEKRKTIIPVFIDIKDLNDESNRGALQRLRKYLCLVIIDAISMRHPTIQREFSRTYLEAFPNTLVAKLSPIQTVLSFTDQLSVLIENHHDQELLRREKLDDDKSCAKCSDPQLFKDWLEQRFESGSINNLFFKG
jgi:hypothetical protein